MTTMTAPRAITRGISVDPGCLNTSSPAITAKTTSVRPPATTGVSGCSLCQPLAGPVEPAASRCPVPAAGPTAWAGPARLHLVPHSNCRVADLPVRKMLYGRHLIADLTLPYGHVLYDYLA